ncbi:MAG: hypothetical protein AAGA56_03920 [Myxococcota bacterium]
MDLCLACGLCCDGTLFASVGTDPQFRANVRLPLVDQRLPLPCPAHTQSGCAVYADRPERCRNFVCSIRGRFDRGLLSRAEAMTVIARTRALAAEARWHAPDDAPWWDHWRALNRLQGTTGSLTVQQASQKRRLDALEEQVTEEFWPPPRAAELQP